MNLLQNLYSLDDDDAESTGIDPDYVSLFEQARMTLDHIGCSEDPIQISNPQKSDWRAFKDEIRLSWSAPLLRTMLLLAGMVICHIPFSAAQWVNRLFVPVCVRYGEPVLTLDLLAKNARKEEAIRHQPHEMCSAGQHLPHESGATFGSQFGKDHFLVDPRTNVPVVILSDFLPDVRTVEQYVKTTSELYAGFSKLLEPNKVGIAAVPLRAIISGSSSP
jgi:hypothetical protein